MKTTISVYPVGGNSGITYKFQKQMRRKQGAELTNLKYSDINSEITN